MQYYMRPMRSAMQSMACMVIDAVASKNRDGPCDGRTPAQQQPRRHLKAKGYIRLPSLSAHQLSTQRASPHHHCSSPGRMAMRIPIFRRSFTAAVVAIFAAAGGGASASLVQVEQYGMAQCPMTSTLLSDFWTDCFVHGNGIKGVVNFTLNMVGGTSGGPVTNATWDKR